MSTAYRSLAFWVVVAVVLGLLIGLAACDDGIVDPGTDPDPEPDPVRDDEPLPELPGDPDKSVLEATFDFSVQVEVTDGEVSVDPETGGEVIRTQIQVGFDPDVKVRDINMLMENYEIEIIDMLPNLPFILFLLSDPGSI
jgi:hypothetical protein